MARSRAHPGRGRLGPIPAAILLGMLTLTATVAVAVWHYQEGRERDAQQEWTQRATRDLDDQVAQTGAAVVGARGLFEASFSVAEDEFDHFAGIQLRRSSLIGINWTPRVPGAARQRFERSSGLRIVERTPDGRGYRPAGVRSEYFPLRYLAPDTRETRAAPLGLDVGVDGGTPAAFAVAQDSGGLAMSSTLQLGGTAADRGTVLVAAVYRAGAPLRTIAQRRAALRGFTSGAWRYDKMAAPVVRLLPEGARLELVNADETAFGTSAGTGEAQRITLGGRSWTVRVSLPRDGTRWVQLAAILGGGLALTVLVALLLVQAERRRREREAGHTELHHEANTDNLTSLGNRRKLQTDFARAAAQATSEEPLGSGTPGWPPVG